MKDKKCIGCGEKLQYNNPNISGYIPKNILETRDNIICKRCFRLKHYGENLEKEEEKDVYRLEVKKAVSEADIVIPIFDIIDFESSFTNEIIDLLEDKTREEEVKRVYEEIDNILKKTQFLQKI